MPKVMTEAETTSATTVRPETTSTTNDCTGTNGTKCATSTTENIKNPTNLVKSTTLAATSATNSGAISNDASSTEAAERRGGARRKRNQKRRKQRTPDTNKEEEKTSQTDNVEKEEEEEESKFVWQSVTKSGSVKKCVLVDGLPNLGRPQVGDTVLVKSQGKLRNGSIIEDQPTLVFSVGEHEVIEGLEVAVQSMFKNELSVISLRPEVAYGSLGRKSDVPGDSRLTYLLGLLHFEKQRDVRQLTCAQRRKAGQARMRLANWWYQRKEYSVAVKCYKRALEFYNHGDNNSNAGTEESRELLQLMEERLRVMRQVASIFKRIANLMQAGQIQ